MKWIFAYVGFQLIVLITLFVFSWLRDKRLHDVQGNTLPPGFVPTNEITIDPIDGRKCRVYYNPVTGERFYHEEK
jgi:hypothetical protein